MSRFVPVVAATLLFLAGQPVAAEEDGPLSERKSEKAIRTSEAGKLLPFTLGAQVDAQRAFISMTSGYDSAHRTALLESAVEVFIWGPFALRAGAIYTAADNTLHTTAGLQVQALKQAKHWLNLAFGVFYKPEGLTEPEGEIEFVVALSRQFGRWGTFLNLVYGQDFDGNERDGEVRLATLCRLARSHLINPTA